MSRRHLTLAEAERALDAGRTVEQWLGATTSDLGPVISFVTCSKSRDGTFSVALHRSKDSGSDQFLDVYAFESIDLDHERGARCASAGAALEYAVKEFGASRERFVNAGVVQDEYADYRTSLTR